MPVTLPPLVQRPSPNSSPRLNGLVPYLVVVHRPVGTYAGATATFLEPSSQVSAHVLTHGTNEATQFVPWHQKAWACVSFNSASYNVEVDDAAWTTGGGAARATAARIVAFICHKTGIPPSWSQVPTHSPGVVRHYDLGIAGGGHTDPTLDVQLWRQFLGEVRAEYSRGGFRPTWGVGAFQRINT
jgi:N-acetyl-anhydromuramyl-L-alanine amidase AmpD